MGETDSMRVDRCVCFDITFSTLKASARECGGGLEHIRERFGCGKGCALCVPYIQKMLQTGQTSFEPESSPTQPRDSL